MNSEGVSSLAVVDNQHNVIGNISTWDVKVSYVVLKLVISKHHSIHATSAADMGLIYSILLDLVLCHC